MCGLFGFVRSTRAAHPETASGVFVELGRLAERRGRDATGFALVSRPPLPPAVVKATWPFSGLWRSHHAPMVHEATVALGHTRHASQGAPHRRANAHPLEAGSLIGTVNGDIDADDLRRCLPPGLPAPQGETDSEVLLLALDRVRGNLEAVCEVLTAVWGEVPCTTAAKTHGGSGEVSAGPGGGKPVAPPWLPGERRVDELLQRPAVDQAVQRPPGGRVADHHDRAPIPVAAQVAQEVLHLRDDLPVALPARVGLVDVPRPSGGELGNWHAVAPAVVALAQPGVGVDGDAAATEGDLGGLDGAGQVGDEHGGDAAGAMAFTEVLGKLAASEGERTRQPSGRDAGFVVGGHRVGLKDDLDGHAREHRPVADQDTTGGTAAGVRRPRRAARPDTMAPPASRPRVPTLSGGWSGGRP
jgi:Glutamine amidotransferase domain